MGQTLLHSPRGVSDGGGFGKLVLWGESDVKTGSRGGGENTINVGNITHTRKNGEISGEEKKRNDGQMLQSGGKTV